MQTLDGRTAVVTGGASGMGRAFADRFARAGMKVVVADIEDGPRDAAVSDILATGAEAIGVRCDVSRAEDHEAVLAAAVDAFGAVNVVCLNAGVGGANGPSWKLTVDDWSWTLGVNLWGVIHGIRTFVPHLLTHGDGHVVTTASIAGHTSSPWGAPYNVSKHGVVTLSETLFHELKRSGPAGIGVTCLCPGFVATNILSSNRNRPGGQPARPVHADADADADRSPGRDAGTSRFIDVVKRMIENGKPPHEVADLVHDAVLTDQFWLFTDEVWDEPIARRHDEIAHRLPPTIPAPRRP